MQVWADEDLDEIGSWGQKKETVKQFEQIHGRLAIRDRAQEESKISVVESYSDMGRLERGTNQVVFFFCFLINTVFICLPSVKP